MAKNKKTKSANTQPVVEVTTQPVVETPSVAEVVNNEPKVSRIQVNVNDLNNPVIRVEVTEFEIDNNKDVFFTDIVKAKRYAHNELLDIKGSLTQSEYSEAYWFIENFI